MAKTKKKRLVQGPNEEAALQRAEQLAQQGNEAFGDPNTKFDLTQDMEEMAMAGVMKPADIDKVKEELDKQTNESPTPDVPVPSVKLSDDPEKRFKELHEFLKGFRSDAPSVAVLKEWKNLHGRVFILNVDDYIFVYRFLKRQEYRQINAQGALEGLREDQIEDNMYDRCMLWPNLNDVEKAMLPAGAVPMIVGQIQIQSLFLDPAAVAQATIKL